MTGSPGSIEDILGDDESQLAVRDIGSTRLFILNNPRRRNALTVAMRRALAAELDRAEHDDGVRALIVIGASNTFCSGLDLSEPPDPTQRIAVRPNPGEAMRAFTKPSIAAVDGFCLTGGLELALACSFVIASDRAHFADTHASIGVFPAWGMTAMLPRAVGIRRARQLALTGEHIDAARALTWGLVNEVVAPDALLARTVRLAELMAAANQTSALGQLALVNAHEGVALTVAIEAEGIGPRSTAAKTIEQ